MEVIRYKYIFILVLLFVIHINTEMNGNETISNSTTNCPYTKIIEDIFKVHNRSKEKYTNLKDSERTKLFLNSVTNLSSTKESNESIEEDLVNDIIASINRIKENITYTKNDEETKLNEAIILSVPEENSKKISNRKNDVDHDNIPQKDIYEKKKDGIGMKDNVDKTNNILEGKSSIDDEKPHNSNAEKTTYVEILTIEPNNTNVNNTTHNIIEVLKHLMPLFNSSFNKELHNITIIERNHNKNHSLTATKNVSTIFVTYCDKDNVTEYNNDDMSNKDSETSNSSLEETAKPLNESDYEYYLEDTSIEDEYDDVKEKNLTFGERKDIMEAAEYGIQKMHELYSVLEPKLYSMGLWLDDTNPARYVAAFNAPSEDVARFSRYGYASLQAATKLKELTSGNSDGLEGRTEEAQFPAASALRQSALLQHCPLRGAPKCPPASKRYRTHDGTCNNLNRPRWGSTMTPVQRFLHPSYSDGLQAPRKSIFGSSLPSAREISSVVHEDRHVENPGITHLLMQWGQFIDHDITSSSQSRGFNGSVPRCCKDGGKDFVPKELLHPECMPIPVPPSDPFYGPRGVRCLDFVRSSPAPRDDCALGWREQINQVSAYIDGSPLYASSARQSDKLRLFRNGMLQYGRVQQRRPILPTERKDELCRGGAVSTDCFKSGDGRVNEHPGLVAAHIVWLRQHNRMAQELAHLNPHWSDEKIYQETRKILGAMVQHITYKEFLPIILGADVMRLFELEPQKKGYYRGYDTKINPSPASSFGSAAFRFGHSLVQPSMVRFDRFHRPINNNVSLHDELTNPSNIWSMGAVDRLLLGMVNQPIQKRDEFITEELTNHLFQTPHFNFGMDLAAINIQRGRDHGVAAYTSWREPCGLTSIEEFDDLFRVMPSQTVKKLKALYKSVDDIDLFTGGMAERPVVGGLVGPTFACIIAQQFSNLRKGDRFWYENGGFESSFTPAQLQQIRRISFAQVLCHTLDTIDNIQPFVFLSADNPDNGRISCQNALLNDFDLSPWIEINSDLNNDISKTENEKLSTQRPRRTKPTTKKPTTTTTQSIKKLTAAASNRVTQKIPLDNSTDGHSTLNKTEPKIKGKYNTTLTSTKNKTRPLVTVQNIDDKLDFKNKTKRYDNKDDRDNDNINTRQHDYNNPDQNNDYDDEETVQSVQSVVVNNLSHKRPYNNYHNNHNRPVHYDRPVITVTENVDKYTYLINYVPRPTEAWRPTTRKTYDRDVVKVTYQTYDDTYRRPNRPYYYNRDDYDDDSYNHRRDRPNTDGDQTDFHSSARSNDETLTKIKTTMDKIDNVSPTTENFYKLVTFGYVGTYKGHMTDDKVTKPETTDKETRDTISKDFSTYEAKHADLTDDNTNTMKLSTFFHYETATKPYHVQRPTRRNDDDVDTKTKYYYVKNVLHKYPDLDKMTENPNEEEKQDIITENYNHPGYPEDKLEQRSVVDKLAFLEEVEKSVPNPGKLRIKVKRPASPAKTPSVAFQVIPSENIPMQWAVYEEKEDLIESPHHRMPAIKTDPYALKEIPKPMNLGLRRRRPGRF